MNETIEFDLIDNAFDYVLSAAEYAKRGSSRDLKYSVLHLAAGVELLLKARLQKEHWSLLFSRVDAASRSSLTSGDFISVDFETAVKRLENIGEVSIDSPVLSHLHELRKLRNKIQHLDISLATESVRSLVAMGADFFLEFGRKNLGDEFNNRGEEVIPLITAQLVSLQEFVDQRLKTIETELAAAYLTLECPVCWQDTMVVGDGNPKCPFCGTELDAEELAMLHAEYGSEQCPDCDTEGTFFQTL